MRNPVILSALLFAFVASTATPSHGQAGRPIPPGVREADKQINGPIEPPTKLKQKPADTGKLHDEADELAKLSAGIPAQIDNVGKGQIPKDLADQLKRIEKLAKHLRSEVAP